MIRSLGALAVLAGSAACSSIPDVRFEDDDAGADGGGADGVAGDAATTGDVVAQPPADASTCAVNGKKCAAASECCSGSCQDANGNGNGVKRCQ